MNVQYVKNDKGENAGVFIPIEEWEDLVERLKNVADKNDPIKDWQKSVVSERMAQYHNNPSKTFDVEEALREIEDDL